MTDQTIGPLLRVALLVLSCAFAAPLPAALAEDPAMIRRMLDAGSVELALARIDALQPKDANAPRWAEWEALRCEALARSRRAAALFARVSALPGEAPAPLSACFVEGARAALVENDPRAARALAGRALWQMKLTPADARAVRLTVIESYISEKRGEDAFRAMLRFQQDYQPLERSVADRFGEALLDLGQDRDALNWLGRADELTPTRLRLQLRGGTLAPEAVIAQARAALARNADPAYWRAIHEAALRAGNRSQQIEALERLLQSADQRREGAVGEAAERLWQTYVAAAGEIGNKQQLLVGDDGAWADYAARRLGSDPFLSRAFFAYLAGRGQNPDIRRNAQLQLAYSLYSGGLDYTALRVMQASGVPVANLDAQTRYLLGTVAANHNQDEVALTLWEGLATPPNAKPDDWQMTLARTALRAGDPEKSVAAVKPLLSARGVTPELVQNALDLAQEMLDLRRLDAAQAVYELVVPVAPEPRAREALFGLGRVHELKGEAPAAADAYLRSALVLQNPNPDALALQARLLAGINLMRAGLKDDARAQFEWLVKNSRDPALVDAAKRGLTRL